MGGRGKTPTVALVAHLLVQAGERPSILSRGYKRLEPDEGVVVVSDGIHRLADLERSGDEPLMLARQVPGAAVLVCDVRATAAALAEASLGATVHVLDDGFQHRSLERHIDLVIVTPGDLRDRRVPFGRLRSSVSSLRRADAVIVDGASAASVADELAPLIDAARTPVFSLTRRLGTPWFLECGASTTSTPSSSARVVALAGIARPERFSHAVAAAGWTVAETLGFADHHPYTRRDLARIRDACRRTSADLVLTTEKDAMRLLTMRPLDVPVAAVPLDVSVDPSNAFHTWLITRLAEVRS